MKLDLVWIIYKSNSKCAREEVIRCTESLQKHNIKINEMISIDMGKNNEFVANAATWRETKIPYDQHRAVSKIIKEIIPANCRLAEGGGVKVSRTKAGNLTIKENKGG